MTHDVRSENSGGSLWKQLVSLFRKIPSDGYILIGMLLLYCVNSFWLKRRIGGGAGTFLRCHFNDLCAGVFIMAYINLLLHSKGTRIRTLPLILLICLAAGMVWDFFAPLINSRSTTDLLDLACYVAGGFVYWTIERTCPFRGKN